MSFIDVSTISFIAKSIELVGLTAIVLGAVFSICRFAVNLIRRRDAYRTLRQDLGRSILLGLEFMVAGDIIATITIEPSLNSVAVLAVIVVIRTFLSFSLEFEIAGDGRPARAPEPGGPSRKRSLFGNLLARIFPCVRRR